MSKIAVGFSLRDRKATSDHIADALREAIHDGQFEDGEELNQVELARHFEVSRIPVRESLRRLQAEGLVSNVAHRRAVVIGLDLDEVIEQIELRAVLEAYLVEHAAPHIPKPAFAKLYKICDETDRITDYGSGWVAKNWTFHRMIYGFADRAAAIALAESMQLKVERYVRRAGSPERLQAAAEEHRQIVEALERGDGAAAAEGVRKHILHTAQAIRRLWETSDGTGHVGRKDLPEPS